MFNYFAEEKIPDFLYLKVRFEDGAKRYFYKADGRVVLAETNNLKMAIQWLI